MSAELFALLTSRDREAAAMVAHGHSNREIATQMGIQETSVKVKISRIFDKLGVRNRVELANFWGQYSSKPKGDCSKCLLRVVHLQEGKIDTN